MSQTIFIGNLSYAVDGHDLEAAFATYGEIVEAKVIKDFTTGRSRGFGFVTFNSTDAARAALDMNEKEMQGRNIRVNYARERDGHGRGDHRGGDRRGQ